MRIIPVLAFLTMTAPATAQMSVSTFGATDAQLCFEAARDDMSTTTTDCDEALRQGGLNRRDEVATRVNRGVLLNRAGRYEEALADFDYALTKNVETAEAYLNRGNSYYLQRRYDDAIADYQKSLEYGIAKADVAWYNIGLAHEAQKDSVKARDAYRMALQTNPDFGPALRKLAVAAPGE